MVDTSNWRCHFDRCMRMVWVWYHMFWFPYHPYYTLYVPLSSCLCLETPIVGLLPIWRLWNWYVIVIGCFHSQRFVVRFSVYPDASLLFEGLFHPLSCQNYLVLAFSKFQMIQIDPHWSIVVHVFLLSKNRYPLHITNLLYNITLHYYFRIHRYQISHRSPFFSWLEATLALKKKAVPRRPWPPSVLRQPPLLQQVLGFIWKKMGFFTSCQQ